MWFIAFIAVAAHNNKRISEFWDKIPEKDRADKEKGCDITPDDYKKECGLNNTSVALGVFMFLWLLANTLIAVYIALYYRVHLITPLEADNTEANNIQEHTKDAFGDSADDVDGYALVDNHGESSTAYGGGAGARYGAEDDDYYDGPYTRRNMGSGTYETGSQGIPASEYSYGGAGSMGHR